MTLSPTPLSPLRIGSLAVPFPVVLAPMAGYTDGAFRSVSRQQGCGLTYTEVVNAEGIVHGSRPTLFLLETLPGERPVAAHIYGCRPDVMAEAAVIIERLNRFDLIDVNAGCPVRKIVAKGCGAALMRDPDKIRDIVQAMTAAVSLPITVKTRIGTTPDALSIRDVAQAAHEGGASAIAIHARTADRKHGGPADWEALASVKAESRIPVIGNGGVNEPDGALRMMRETGVDGVMIGRAAIGAPWIFDDIRQRALGLPAVQRTVENRKSVIMTHVRLLAALKERDPRRRRKSGMAPDIGAALHFRPFLLKYLTPFQARSDIARQLQSIRTLSDVVALIEAAINNSEPFRAR